MKRETGKTDSECEQLFRMFQAFIRQAKTFYTSSEALHHRASPLLAYYAFMNLAKAYLCRSAPDLMLQTGSLYHGLVSCPPNPNFQKEIVDTHDGVFWHFYKTSTGIELPKGTGRVKQRKRGFRLSIPEMLLYVSDLSGNYENFTGDRSRMSRGMSRYTFDAEGNIGKWLIAIGDFHGFGQYPDAFANFFSKFEEVQLHPAAMERIFGLLGEQRTANRIFQSKQHFRTADHQSRVEFVNSLDPVRALYICNYPFQQERQFMINTPLGPSFNFPWNEVFSNYVLFFYLGSLVRYHPYYLETLLGKKEGWLIEQFANGARLTLLRHFVIRILNKGLVFAAR